MSAQQCPQCGYDLSQAPRTGAAASRCPGCGGSVTLGGPPSPPVRRPPAPPRRPGQAETPAAAPARAKPPTPAAASNPFQAAPAEASASNPFQAAPAVETSASNPFQAAPAPESAASNPFLDAPAAAPAPQSSAGQPRVIPPAQGAPLVSRPDMPVPYIKDAHAEFRKGGWKRPAMFIGGGVVLLLGLFVLLPDQTTQESGLTEANMERATGVIGGRLPPSRVQEGEAKDASATEQKAAFAKTEQDARERQESGAKDPERPADIPQDSDFADAFKSAAR